jgi:hypothetical protein
MTSLEISIYVAGVIVLIIIIGFVLFQLFYGIYINLYSKYKTKKSGFYTESAREIPTRPYDTPYTGTEPLGAWGATPWAETALAMAPTRCAR